MSLWSLTRPPNWKSNPKGANDYIVTKSGWVNAETGELVVAIGNLDVHENAGHTSVIEYCKLASATKIKYKAADVLGLAINYSKVVNVVTTGGTPYIAISIGGANVHAVYASGTGTSKLVFNYTIQSTDSGALTVTSPIVLNGGTIKDADGKTSPLTFTPPSGSALVIDGLTPAATVTLTGTAFTTGNQIPVIATFNDAVTVTGTPSIALHINASTVQATYVSGSGTTALHFAHTVAAGDVATAGQFTIASPIALNGGKIANAVGTNATLTFTPPTTSTVTVN